MTLGWFCAELGIFTLLLILSGIFSSAEVAYTSLSKSQINRVKRVKVQLMTIWEKSPELVLGVLLLSNNTVNIGVGVISAGIAIGISHHTEFPQAPLSTLIGILTGSILLICGEIIPKVWAKRYPVSWTLKIAPLMNIWIRILSPIARGAVWITNKIVLRRFKKSKKSPWGKPNDLKDVLTHSVIPSSYRRILDNLLEFSETKVKDVMTPRSLIESVSMKAPMNKIITRVIKSGFSRIPIYAGTIDNMVGVLYSKDFLVAWRSGALILLEDLIRPIHRVSEDMPLPELMRIFRSGHHHLAIVEDQTNKKLKGLVTLEDAIESIVGEIEEE